MATKSRAVNHLPSLPQVMVRVLDAVNGDLGDFQQLAEIVRQDAAISARLIEVANSSSFSRGAPCRTVESALLQLGTETIRTLVITAAIKQFFNRFQHRHDGFLKLFWRRSLIGASLAHILANLSGYRSPDHAYLCGLLTDVGQLVLLNQHGDTYTECWYAAADDHALVEAERALFGRSHCDVGAELMERWRVSGFMADAIRYQHEDIGAVRDAHHLVKVINLASQLSAPDGPSDTAIARAGELFDLHEDLTRELHERVAEDIARTARSLGIDLDTEDTRDMAAAEQRVGEHLSNLAQIGHLSSAIWQAHNLSALEQAIRRTVYITLGVEHCVLFRLSKGGRHLHASLAEPSDGSATEPDLVLPLLAGRSVVSDALLEQRPLDSKQRELRAVVDRQLLRQCRSKRLLAVPLLHQTQPVGVLVLGIGTEDWPASPPLLATLCREIAAALARQHEWASGGSPAAAPDALRQRVHEAVHEAGNPLSIIGNYLETLRVRLGEGHEAHEDIELIKQEIERVGSILLRLTTADASTDKAPTAGPRLDINRLVEQLASIFGSSICAARNIELELRLASELPPVAASTAHIKQILTNLVKNATEALSEGGKIVIATAGNVRVGNMRFVQISVEDNGPGIPDTVMKNLFSPLDSSSKRGAHAGLGLSITKRLVDELKGTIMCRSDRSGTSFQVLIPE